MRIPFSSCEWVYLVWKDTNVFGVCKTLDAVNRFISLQQELEEFDLAINPKRVKSKWSWSVAPIHE